MKKEHSSLTSWIQFSLGLLIIYLFMVVLLPLLSLLPFARTAIHTIEERDIDPRALFYTESQQAVEAGRWMNEQMKKKKSKISPPFTIEKRKE